MFARARDVIYVTIPRDKALPLPFSLVPAPSFFSGSGSPLPLKKEGAGTRLAPIRAYKNRQGEGPCVHPTMDFEMQKQDELGSVLPYLLSPVSLCTSLVILICIYVIVPFIGPRFIPSYNGLKENRRRFDSFLGTSLHHAVVPALAVYALASGAITNQVHVQNQSVLGLYILQMTQGFLVAEFIVILHDPIQRRRRRINLFHHVLFITVGCYMAFLLRGYGLFFAASFEISEISTLFVHIPTNIVLLGVRKGLHCLQSM